MRYRVTITDNNIGVHHVPSWRKQSGCLPAAEIAMAKDGLRGRTALVTGGSRGIGAAISRALAEAGAGLAINYRERSDHAKNLADELLNTGVRAITVQADVSQPDAVAKMVEVVKSELGTIDILVNNAGIAITRGINDLSEADFDRTIAVNLKSVFLCTQAVLPMMQAKQWGRIINISSGAARGAGAIGTFDSRRRSTSPGPSSGRVHRSQQVTCAPVRTSRESSLPRVPRSGSSRVSSTSLQKTGVFLDLVGDFRDFSAEKVRTPVSGDFGR
jgi:3-oxoacyl-[acyl-carrier protein] reductase